MTADEQGLKTVGGVTTHRASVASPGAPGHDAGLVAALTILYHPRLERVGERAVLADLAIRDALGLSRMEPHFGAIGAAGGAPLGDTHLSRKPLRLIALPGGHLRLAAGEGGAQARVQGAPMPASLDVSPGELSQGVVIELAERVVLLLHWMDPSLPEGANDLGLVGASHLLEQARRDVRRVADLPMAVLVRGETGTGKELVARAIHQVSGRRAQPFVAVNMAAIPPSLAAAELFGAERGAYTGAVRSQPGFFGLAHEGTLFLDEIGETPPEVQAMLLRALETGEVQAVGAQQPRPARVRLIAATDADLEAKIADGSFRAPLLHRLSGYEIALPPLRERREDIGLLLLHFLRQELAPLGEADRLLSTGAGGAPWLPASLVARLARHDWPGNLRQLRNVVRQLVVGSRGAPSLSAGPALERLLGRGAEERDGKPRPPPSGPKSRDGGAAPADRRRPSDVREEELLAALRGNRWDLKATAETLRVSRTSLYAMVESCPRVRRAGDLTPDELSRSHLASGGDVDAMVDSLEVSKRALLRRLRELGLR